MLLPLIIFIPLLGAWLPAALSRAFGVDPARTTAGLVIVALAIVLGQAGAVLDGATFVQSWP
ncbi:MAG: hypothetical protein NDI84_12645, partial [Steroidobacteraceae bacterium]|nr:hypothetical protein [Steroidobacteraceae bacterium]